MRGKLSAEIREMFFIAAPVNREMTIQPARKYHFTVRKAISD